MANNRLSIVISAIDDATKTINKVNRSFANAMLPVTRLNRSISNLVRATGVPKLAGGFMSVGKAAANVAEKIGKIFAPLAAIIGVGSIAGVAALATEWGKLAMNVTNAAQSIGMSASQLMGLQGTARLAGVSSEELTSSLTSLGNTLEDARFGRNQGALMLMNRLGIGLHRLKNGSVDTQRAMMDLATVMQRPGIKGNAQVENLIASQFGVSGLLPLLRRGPQAIAAYQQQVRALGGEMSGPALEAATQFETHLLLLQTAADGLKNSIGSALIPVLQPLVDQLTNWIAANRELIATKVAEYAKKIADWVKTIDFKKVGDDISNTINGVLGFVDAIGGWKVALAGILAIMGAPLLGAIATLGTALVQLGAIVWANPILAALGTIGFLSYEIYKHWNDIGTSMANATPPAFGDGAAGGPAVGRWGKLGDWLGLNKPAAANPSTPQSRLLFASLESQYGLPRGLLDAVWNKESGRGANMRSPKGALGHFQFMPDTAAQYGLTDPMDLNHSADAAARMYRDLLRANGGNLDRALAAYNWGQGNLNRYGAGGEPSETRDYVRAIESMMGNGAGQTDVPTRSMVSSMIGSMGEQVQAAAAAMMGSLPGSLGGVSPPGGTGVQGQRLAFDFHIHGLPAGASVTGGPRDDSLGPTKVAYSMPMGVTP